MTIGQGYSYPNDGLTFTTHGSVQSLKHTSSRQVPVPAAKKAYGVTSNPTDWRKKVALRSIVERAHAVDL